ncbi:hypothetical protein TNIN_141401 [Trichonephila inaurata madagascariensis]|uniref:Uncharacterized protein n=1 Tax=Trichonephila inaurata madagascariensis TaxID=2747483 RepID=A0A8X6JGI4_9ARAC|nr:hypothetical protein TNIN_141401 [Trichonephila inaurata madagascariensis]
MRRQSTKQQLPELPEDIFEKDGDEGMPGEKTSPRKQDTSHSVTHSNEKKEAEGITYKNDNAYTMVNKAIKISDNCNRAIPKGARSKK